MCQTLCKSFYFGCPVAMAVAPVGAMARLHLHDRLLPRIMAVGAGWEAFLFPRFLGLWLVGMNSPFSTGVASLSDGKYPREQERVEFPKGNHCKEVKPELELRKLTVFCE